MAREGHREQDLGPAALDEIQQGLQGAAGVGRQRDGAIALGGSVQRPGSCSRDGHVRPRAQQLHYLQVQSRSTYHVSTLRAQHSVEC